MGIEQCKQNMRSKEYLQYGLLPNGKFKSDLVKKDLLFQKKWDDPENFGEACGASRRSRHRKNKNLYQQRSMAPPPDVPCLRSP